MSSTTSRTGTGTSEFSKVVSHIHVTLKVSSKKKALNDVIQGLI